MFRKLCAVLVLFALAGGLGACLPKNKQWTHPRMADPRKEDKLFESDTAFCEQKLGPGPQGEARRGELDQCLMRLGWQRKE